MKVIRMEYVTGVVINMQIITIFEPDIPAIFTQIILQ